MFSRPWMFCGLVTMTLGAVLLCQQGCRPHPSAEPQMQQAADGWKSLFDGRTLAGWKVPELGGEGKVHVENGAIVLDMGANMTAIVWTGDVPDNNYEISLEGMRLEGNDFFCTTTFRVGDEPCTLVVGGWGGSTIGLSNVDGMDASENATTGQFDFADERWYRVRIRVTDEAVMAWIDDRQVVHQPRKDHQFGIRVEVTECRPLGICTWATKGAVRNIRLRELPPN